MITRRQVVLGAALLLVAGLLLFGLVVLMKVLSGTTEAASVGPEIVLPVLAIAGVVVLLIALALISMAFALVKLSDPTQALGLPEGSVRAVVALSLVVLFAIITIFLYGDLTNAGHVNVAKNVTEAEKQSFAELVPHSTFVKDASTDKNAAPTYTVYYADAVSAPAQDFAKQLLVLIGTLVTAVSSFYFGAKAGAGSSPVAVQPAPAIRSITPNTLARGGPMPFEIAGDNLLAVTDVKIVSGATQVLATGVTSNANVVHCQLTVAAAMPAGPWDVIVSDRAGNQGKLAGGLTVT